MCGREVRAGQLASITAVIAERAGALHLMYWIIYFLTIYNDFCKKCVNVLLDWTEKLFVWMRKTQYLIDVTL